MSWAYCSAQLDVKPDNKSIIYKEVFFKSSKMKIAAITGFPFSATDTFFTITFLEGRPGAYGDLFYSFSFKSRRNIREFVDLLASMDKKRDHAERYSVNSDDHKSLSLAWIGGELIVIMPEVPGTVYMRCPSTTIEKLKGM